jgi:hypothetical protein
LREKLNREKHHRRDIKAEEVSSNECQSSKNVSKNFAILMVRMKFSVQKETQMSSNNQDTD